MTANSFIDQKIYKFESGADKERISVVFQGNRVISWGRDHNWILFAVTSGDFFLYKITCKTTTEVQY